MPYSILLLFITYSDDPEILTIFMEDLASDGVDFARNSIIYRHAYEMPHPSKDKALKSMVDLSMGTAASVMRKFAYMLIEVNEGDRDAESIALFFSEE